MFALRPKRTCANGPAYLRLLFGTLPAATNLYANSFAHVLFDLNPGIFGMMAVDTACVTATTIGKVCDEFALRFHIVGSAKTDT
ncbi:hypothetical protein IWQ56_001799 [Coemansia nantahalensis]|nr:hypothetical protein IWQ56_001799 [Coemansia nantahalensis]